MSTEDGELEAAQGQVRKTLQDAMATAPPREAELLAMLIEQVDLAEFWADEATRLSKAISETMTKVDAELAAELGLVLGASMIRAIRKAMR